VNDARLSTDLIAYERAREKEALQASARDRTASGQTLGRPRGILTAEEAAARRALQDERVSTVNVRAESSQVVPASGDGPADPQVLLRHARLGVIVAVALAVLLAWMWRRRGH